jgi:DNA-directed RNA polymerase subunit RPC12/RpoP
MRIIRGTGDAKKMKGQVQATQVPTMRCTRCSQTAFQGKTSSGQLIYRCGACGAEFKLQRL